jgi:hypothetical protein
MRAGTTAGPGGGSVLPPPVLFPAGIPPPHEKKRARPHTGNNTAKFWRDDFIEGSLGRRGGRFLIRPREKFYTDLCSAISTELTQEGSPLRADVGDDVWG